MLRNSLFLTAIFLLLAFTTRAQYQVRWTDLFGVTESSGILTKTAATGSWTNASATSSNYLAPNTDGWIECTFTTQVQVQIGFVSNNFSAIGADVFTNAVGLGATGTITAYEGSGGASFGNYTSGDVFRVSREGSQVKYYKNGTVFRTIAVSATLPLWVRANIYTTGQASPAVTASFDAKILIRPVITGTSSASGVNTGSISLNIEGGHAPYTYAWNSTETTSSISNKGAGTYSVTVTDADLRTATSSFAIGYKVGYKTLYNATESNGILTTTSGTGWTGGADGANRTFVDAWMEFVVTDYTSSYIIGIGSGTDLALNAFRNAIMISSDHKFYAYESGLPYAQEGYRVGDVFRISRESGNIKYYKNGVVFRTVTASANTTFIPKTSIGTGSSPRVTCSVDSRIFATADVKGTSVANGTGSIALSAYGGVAPYTYAWTAGNGTSPTLTNKNRGTYTVTITDAEGRTLTKAYSIGYNMIYTDLVNATESNGIISKSTPAWNGGGFTSNMVSIGTTDAWFEWVVPQEITSQFIVGALSAFDSGWTSSEVKTSLGYHPSSNAPSLIAYEGGGQYALGVAEPGDILRIERTGGTLYYKLNGTVIRSVTTSNVEWRLKVAVYQGDAPRITSSFDARPLINATVTGTQDADNTAAITTSVAGGKAPYTYSWNSTETTASISSKPRGTYTLTTTDAELRTGSRTYKAGYFTNWTSLSNVTPGSGNVLTKTSAAGWNATALGTNIVPSNTDGWLEFVIDNTNSNYAVGFSSQDLVQDPVSGMRYAILLNWNSTASVVNNGATLAAGQWMPGDVFRVGREGGNFVAYRNGVLLNTFGYPASYELKPKVAINTGSTPNILSQFSSTIMPIAVVTGTGYANNTGGIVLTTSGGYGSYTYAWTSNVGPVSETTPTISGKPRGAYTVTITDGSGASIQRTYDIGYKQDYTWLVGVSLNGNGLTRTATGTGWGQGANTYNVLPANTDGYLEVVAQDVTSYYAFGFGHKNSGFDIADFKNAFTVNGVTGAVGYYEGVTAGSLSSVKPGDVLKLAREGSNIAYYKNGVAFRTIATNPALELYLKVLVNSQVSPPIVSSFDTAPVLKTRLAGGAANNLTCSAYITVDGATAPYTYSWSSGETTSSVTSKPFGAYTVTVTDAEGRQTVRSYGFGFKNFLTEQVNLVPTGGSPDSYNGTSTPAGANSTNIIPETSTNDWIEWVHQANSNNYQIGFGWNDHNFGPIEFLYSIGVTNTGTVSYYEGSTGVFLTNCEPGDVFRIAKESGSIKYYRNGAVVRTVAITTNYELKPKFYLAGGTVPPIIASTDSKILPIATVVGTGKNNSGGSISVAPVGGSGGYTYNWGTTPGTTNSQTNLSRGSYTVTVTDNQGRTASRTYQVGYRPQMQNLTNVTDNANTYTKTAGSSYDGGATSSGYIPANAGGWMEMVVPTQTAQSLYRVGFSYADGSYTAPLTLRNGLILEFSRNLAITENGIGFVFGNILPGDVLRIERSGSNMVYSRNGIAKRTVAIDPSLELHWKLQMASGYVPKVNTSFDSKVTISPLVEGVTSSTSPGDIAVSAVGGTPQYAYSWSPSGATTATASSLAAGTHTVTVTDYEGRTTVQSFTMGPKPLWANLTGVNLVGQALVKTAAAGWNSGAVTSSPLLANKDGWIEFAITGNNDSYVAGFTTTPSSYLNTSFKHAVFVDPTTSMLSTYLDATPTPLCSYQIGDVIRIERTGSTITYKRNGASVRTASTTAGTELRVKTAINLGTAPSIISSFEIGESANLFNNWIFQYKYDGRHRQVQRKMPGADWVYMVFDERDRLVLMQDGAMRPNKQWQFTKYDFLNRAVSTGIYTADAFYTQDEMSQKVCNYYTTNPDKYGEVRGTTMHGYTNQSFPTDPDAFSYWTVTYYDDYDWINGVVNYPDSLRFSDNEYTDATVIEAPQSTRTRGMVTGTKTKVLDGGPMYLYSASYYDEKGRVIQGVSENYKLGHDRVTNVLDFTGRVTRTKTKHVEADLSWRDKLNLVENGRQMVSISPTPTFPYCYAFSKQFLPANQDGWVEAIATTDSDAAKIGFTANANSTDFDYAVGLGVTSAGSVRIYTGASGGGTNYTPSPNQLQKGDRVKIARVGSTIRFYKNDIEITAARITTGVNSGQLYVGVSMYSPGSIITGVSSTMSSMPRITWRTFEYDDNGRLKNVRHRVNYETEVLISAHQYNEVGQLVDKSLHSLDNGVTSKQSLDYRYNIRGWMTSINGSALDPNSDTGHGSDFFGMDILYEQEVASLNAGAGLYDGNISAIKWSSNLGLGSIKEVGYAFGYDKYSRLKSAAYAEKTSSWNPTTKFAENVTQYDLNGNIIKLNRTNATVKIDDLTYGYGTGSEKSNKLLKVDDIATSNKMEGFSDGGNADNDYTYDLNGNMLTDKNKSITSNITYIYPLNLPVTIYRAPVGYTSGTSVTYIYDAAGRKLHQSAAYAGSRRGSDYDGDFLYEDDELQAIKHEEGRVATAHREAISHNDGSTLVGLTMPNGNVNVTLDPISSHNQKTYLKVVTTPNTTNNIVFLADGIPVLPGETYLVRAKGYSSTTSGSPWIRVRIVQSGQNVDLTRVTILPNGADADSWIEQNVMIPMNTPAGSTLSVGLSHDATGVTSGTYYVDEFEVQKLSTQASEYQYDLKDHLGNVRLSFTTKDETTTATATLEDENQSHEYAEFVDRDKVRRINSVVWDHTYDVTTPPNGSTYAERLNGTTNEVIGLIKTLSVMPGDKVHPQVFAKYYVAPANPQGAFQTLMQQILQNMAPAGTFVDGSGYLTNNASQLPGNPVVTKDQTAGWPKAYLNWLVYDRDFNVLLSQCGAARIPIDAIEDGTNKQHKVIVPPAEITIQQAGYVYIYLSNETGAQSEVYFDDFTVEHVKSPVIQTQDYYPFGLTFNGYNRENSLINKYLYNGKETQTAISLGWIDYGARMYMPDIGRWGAIDPLSEKMRRFSPYTYAFDNPIRFIDRDGMKPWPVAEMFNGFKRRIDSWFGPRDVKDDPQASKNHKGLDINFGSKKDDYGAPVQSTHEGTASTKDNVEGKNGRTIYVTSPDGTFRTAYFHLSKINIEDGSTIKEGQQIAEIGTSGRGSEDGVPSHLHYEIQKLGEDGNWTPIDPTGGKGKDEANIIDPQSWIKSDGVQPKNAQGGGSPGSWFGGAMSSIFGVFKDLFSDPSKNEEK
jgi:RHS repeat-associated protein